MEQTKPVYYDFITPEKFFKCFEVEALDDEYPIQIAPIGLKDILIPKKSENRLSALQPNLEKIKEISECYGGRGYYCETKKLNVE